MEKTKFTPIAFIAIIIGILINLIISAFCAIFELKDYSAAIWEINYIALVKAELVTSCILLIIGGFLFVVFNKNLYPTNKTLKIVPISIGIVIGVLFAFFFGGDLLYGCILGILFGCIFYTSFEKLTETKGIIFVGLNYSWSMLLSWLAYISMTTSSAHIMFGVASLFIGMFFGSEENRRRKKVAQINTKNDIE